VQQRRRNHSLSTARHPQSNGDAVESADDSMGVPETVVAFGTLRT
jgi:hypothetical protein